MFGVNTISKIVIQQTSTVSAASSYLTSKRRFAAVRVLIPYYCCCCCLSLLGITTATRQPQQKPIVAFVGTSILSNHRRRTQNIQTPNYGHQDVHDFATRPTPAHAFRTTQSRLFATKTKAGVAKSSKTPNNKNDSQPYNDDNKNKMPPSARRNIGDDVVVNRPVVHVESDGDEKLMPSWMMKERTRVLNDVENNKRMKQDGGVEAIMKQHVDSNDNSNKCVVYWMQRDVRVMDNWALLYASHLAQSYQVPLRVVYALIPPPPSSQTRQVDENNIPDLVHLPMTKRYGSFLLDGLEEVHKKLRKWNIPLYVVQSESHDVVGETVCKKVVDKYNAVTVVCDFSPITQFRQWMEIQTAPILDKANIPFVQVDTHNIVPVWTAAEKRQVGARTLRPKIHKVIKDYLQDFPNDNLKECNQGASYATKLNLPDFCRKDYETYLQMDESVLAISFGTAGLKGGINQYDHFVKYGLQKYNDKRNDPNERNVCSNLSPWINHGHISFQRIMMLVKQLNKYADGTASFIEEGVVRRELSDNYLYYTPNEYDKLSAAAEWAQETLRVHESDEREYVYTLQELERGETHDDLWNAAQLQVVREGQMHGFLRMYWAKKILEWTPNPTIALRTAQYFNDKYALDGRDPNGFVGVGWSIMGIHDQGWKEREIFGKIRYMNYNGCKRKFSIPNFVARYKGATENAIKAANKKHSGENKRKSSNQSAGKTSKKAKA